MVYGRFGSPFVKLSLSGITLFYTQNFFFLECLLNRMCNAADDLISGVLQSTCPCGNKAGSKGHDEQGFV